MFLSETKKKYKTASYTRLSQDDGDKEESNSITNQKELIRDFLNRHEEFILVEEYADDGYSGVNFNRPDFQRLMEDVKAGRINCIVVKDLSRFGRNYIETGKYLEQIFPYLGVRFIAINDNTDTIPVPAINGNPAVILTSSVNANSMILFWLLSNTSATLSWIWNDF